MVNRQQIADELNVPVTALVSNVKRVIHFTAPLNNRLGTTNGADAAGTYVYPIGKLEYTGKLVDAYLYARGSALATDKFWISKYNGTVAAGNMGTPMVTRIMGSHNGVNGALRGAANKFTILTNGDETVATTDLISFVYKHVASDRLRGLAVKMVFQ